MSPLLVGVLACGALVVVVVKEGVWVYLLYVGVIFVLSSCPPTNTTPTNTAPW